MTCLTCPGAVIADAELHAAWHARVLEQTGLAGGFTVHDLRRVRGVGGSVGETSFDAKAVASGKRAPGWRRKAAR